MSGLFRKVDCHSLPVSDLDAAIEFYEGKLGNEVIWRSKTNVGLKMPDSEAELVLHTDERPIETNLYVESVPEAIETFTQVGGKVVKGPFEIRIGKCALLEDPWGNRIVILDTSKGLLKTDESKWVIEDSPSA